MSAKNIALPRNLLIQGNCIEEMKKLPDDSVDLIFADPPYWMRVEGTLKRPEGTDFDGCDDDWDNGFQSNQDYAEFTRQWLSECHRILAKNGSMWVIGGMQCIYTIGAVMQELGFWFINDVVWHKSNPTPNFMGTRLNNSHETLIWATKDKKSKFTFNYKTAKQLNGSENISETYLKQMGSVWRFPVCSGNERLKDDNGEKLHSTQKPEELLYRIIAISTKIGDVVFDPFGGTMTTAAMAKKLGRDYLSIEQSEKYINAGRKRVAFTVFEDNDIARAVFDIKPMKAPMEEMIKAGFFEEWEKFYLKNSDLSAELLPNGKLNYQGEEVDMHTLAARLKQVKADRLNGFSWWHVERSGERVGIDEVREWYRKAFANTTTETDDEEVESDIINKKIQ